MAFLPSFYTVLVAGAPLPRRYLEALQSIEVEASVSQAAIFRLNFQLSRTLLGDWDALEVDFFRPLFPVQIRITLGRPLSETLINGYVRDATLDNGGRPGTSTLRVVGMDATTTIMNLHEKPMPWPNLPDGAIAAVIFGQYGMIPLTTPTAPTRTVLNTTTIQRATDGRFLMELARRNSFECYVQPDPLIGRDFGYFGPPRSFMPPQGVLSVDFGLASNLFNFNVGNNMLQATAAAAVRIDESTKAPIPALAPATLEPPMGLEPTLSRIIPPPLVRPTATDSANPAETQRQTQSIANRSSRSVRAGGDVDGLKFRRVLRPGFPVAVRGAGRQYSGIYYVTQVTHSITTEQYTQRFQGWRNAVGLTGAEPFIHLAAAIP